MNKSRERKKILTLLYVSCIIGAVLPYISVFSVWEIRDAGFDGNTSSKNMYWAIDALTPEDEAFYFSQTYNMNNMISYIDAMENSDAFQYCVYGPQTVYCGNDEIMTYEVNMKTIELFPVNLESGSNFEYNDFQYSGTNEVFVLVGYNLREKYPLGTKIQVEFMCTDMAFIVKGILADGESFPFHDKYSNENDNIIVPSIRYITDSNDSFLKKAICLQHISGFLASEKQNDFSALLKAMDSYREKYEIFNIKFARIDDFAVWMLRLRNNALLFISAQFLILAYVGVRWVIICKCTSYFSSVRCKLIVILSITLAEVVLCILLRDLLLTYTYNWVYVGPYFAFELVCAFFINSLMKRSGKNENKVKRN